MTTSALSVSNIVKRYGNHLAVDGISFDVPMGSIFGILGPNGAGKSTTLRMVNDIIIPDSGNITILGDKKPGRAAAKEIGYLPEERGLYPKMKVIEMISFMGELRGLSSKEAKKRGLAWLERLGLTQWEKNLVQDLSKGMQQKVQFACAVIHEPRLLILDEPWSGLDPINAEVLKDVVEAQKAKGNTVIFSTHQMEQAEKICDEIVIIARGKKVLDGSLQQVKRDAARDKWIAIAFTDENSSASSKLLSEQSQLITRTRTPRMSDGADMVVEVESDSAVQGLLAFLLERRIPLRKFEVLTPSLHDIFVERVGEANVAARRDAAASVPSASAEN